MTRRVPGRPVRTATRTHTCYLQLSHLRSYNSRFMSLEKSSLSSLRRFGSAVRTRGTKGLINKSNGPINIQTALRERARHVGEPALRCALPPSHLVMVIHCSRLLRLTPVRYLHEIGSIWNYRGRARDSPRPPDRTRNPCPGTFKMY